MRILFVMAALLLPLAEAHAADLKAGEKKAQVCVLCHRFDSPLGAPTLEQQPQKYLADQIAAYKAGRRRSPTMDPNVGGLSTRDIENIAAWFSAQRARPARIVLEPEAATIARGEQAARELDCIRCHAPQRPGESGVPRLAGQPPGYLALRIAELRGGQQHPMLGTASGKIDDAVTQALAAWFGKLEP
jgi:cytochrome c553